MSEPIKKTTSCCALAQMVANNATSLPEIQKFLAKEKKESEGLVKNRVYRYGVGERAFFCITLPKETTLEKTLKEAGFKHITSINRRHCYPDGELKMWMINW